MTEADDRAGTGGGALRASERTIIAGVLALIALLAGIDLLVDQRQGVSTWHVLTEATVAVAACFGAFLLLRGAWQLRRRLDVQSRNFLAFRQQAEAWRTGSRKYLDGLSRSITNVWAMEIEPSQRFIYELARPQDELNPEGRLFRVEFDLTKPVDLPPTPWGY